MDEFQAMQSCIDALSALTPDERERAMRWLNARVTEDREKELQAAKSVGTFLRLAAAEPCPSRTAQFLEFLGEPRRWSELRDHFNISSDYTNVFLHRAKKNGLVRSPERGVWVRA